MRLDERETLGCNVFGIEQSYCTLRTDTESSSMLVGMHGGKKEVEEKVKSWGHDDVCGP